MKSAAVLASLLVLLITPSIASAEVTTNIKVNTSTGNNTINGVTTGSNNTKINISSNGEEDTEVKIENGQFTIKGTINWVGDNSFKVSNQEVFIDSGLANNLKNQGVLKVDQRVTVKGNSSNGKLTATEVNGEGSSSTPSNPTATPSKIPTPQPSSTLTPTATPTGTLIPTPTTTPQSNDELSEEEKGVISQMIDTLQGLIDKLKDLL